MDGSWTIAQLAELAAGALAARDQPGHRLAQLSGRVRDLPNERLIRWYVTVGLVDPPLSRRGRVAWYGPRHLLQLVAIKRRQAEGRSLAEIQAELTGATNASLAAVARVPEAVLAAGAGALVARSGGAAPARATGPAASTPGAPAPAARPSAAPGRPATGTAVAAGASQTPARFWAQQPKPPAAAPSRSRTSGEGRPQTAGPDAGLGTATEGRDWPRLAAAVRLAPGVALLLDGAEREPGPGDLAAIAAAAGPLLDVLAGTGLRPADQHTALTAVAPGSPPGGPHAPERSRT
jgi:DNA-binding transcriptional MerR regulator